MNNYSGFGLESKVLMYDNTIKDIKDIMVGDLLWGDDNMPRKVLETFKGEGDLYLIQQSRASHYMITNNHQIIFRATSIPVAYYKIKNRSKPYILYYFIKCKNVKCKNVCCKKGFKSYTLGYDTEKEAEEAKRLLLLGELDPNYVKEGDIFNMSAIEYLNVCTKFIRLNRLKGYKVPYPVVHNLNYELPLDPYFLGIWLGDGCASRAIITSTDIEIEEYLYQFAEKYEGLTVHKKTTEVGYISNTGPVAKKGYHAYSLRYNKKRLNPIRITLDTIGVLNNKHIPDIYMNASEEDRFKLLAGLIDTDGSLHVAKENDHINRLSYRFSQAECHHLLVFQAYTLAKSLGLNVASMEESYIPPVGRPLYKDGKALHTNYCFSMTGENISKIPCLIERKKVAPLIDNFQFRTTHTVV